ncbi:hypothetical protein BDV97DRAFT_342054 [Delphinella strobiligena]|nr:hypothetical protein BDV97DRAFT_342054 [Delphinella strobiligena]
MTYSCFLLDGLKCSRDLQPKSTAQIPIWLEVPCANTVAPFLGRVRIAKKGKQHVRYVFAIDSCIANIMKTVFLVHTLRLTCSIECPCGQSSCGICGRRLDIAPSMMTDSAAPPRACLGCQMEPSKYQGATRKGYEGHGCRKKIGLAACALCCGAHGYRGRF